MDYKLYGLDRGGAVICRETIEAANAGEAKPLALRRLEDFEQVELWARSLRILRARRETSPTRRDEKPAPEGGDDAASAI